MDPAGQLDWNLVPALAALLTEQNVSRAAGRLGISQPAASSALSRLRRHFNDQLLLRRGNSYELTPLAQQLLPLTRDAVTATRSILESRHSFEASTSDHEFVIASTDYGQTVIAPHLLAAAAEQAPRVRFTFVWPFTRATAEANDLLATVDGWLAPRELLSGVPFDGLVADRWVCVVSETNDRVGDVLTLQDVAALPWVIPAMRSRTPLPQLKQLNAHGIQPTYEVMTDTFASVPFLVAGTDRLGIVQERIARRLAPAARVRILECPWTMAPVHFTLWSSPSVQSSPAHRWLREFTTRVLASI
jgi:DNA-binding transcriptional LysR family regulator